MKHFGDITKIHGQDVPKVHIITGGSPCQDLSLAGKRAGLAGQRSGLFMEQIRIIKEMREYDKANGRTDVNIRPRYMVWKNVCGAFSSNNGEDFRAVLEETARIAQSDISIPRFTNGRWAHAGCIMGNGWSIAWRVHDAQFWGVPQRRNRISLVADFGGETAPEILFERESVSRDFEQGAKTWEETSGNVADCAGKTSATSAISFQERAGKPGGGKGILIQVEHVGALSTVNNQRVCYSTQGGEDNSIISIGHDIRSARFTTDEKTDPLTSNDYKDPIKVSYASIVRNLTPLECERLQGYPDGWTDIGDWIDSKGKKRKGDSDAPRYKALGNSIALPFWEWMAKRMAKFLPEGATMASLFDGIGGFPLVFSRAGIKPVWASEIEEFAIAVTKIRFPEEENA